MLPYFKAWNYNQGTPGSGYQGVCYKCGIVGHKAADCTRNVGEIAGEPAQQGSPTPEVPGEAKVAGSVKVGGVWYVCAVERTRLKEEENEEEGADAEEDKWEGSKTAQGRHQTRYRLGECGVPIAAPASRTIPTCRSATSARRRYTPIAPGLTGRRNTRSVGLAAPTENRSRDDVKRRRMTMSGSRRIQEWGTDKGREGGA